MKHLTPKNILIAIAVLYSISVLERLLGNTDTQTEQMIQYEREYNALQKDVENLNKQIHNYEIKMLKNSAVVSGMSNAELDSTFAALTR